MGTRATWAKFTKIELWRIVSALLSAGKIGVLGMSRSEVKVKYLQKAKEGYECCIYHLLVSYFLIISGGNGHTWSPIGAQERDSLGKRIEISKRSKNLVTVFLFVCYLFLSFLFFYKLKTHKNWEKFGTVWQWIQSMVVWHIFPSSNSAENRKKKSGFKISSSYYYYCCCCCR